MADGYRRNRVWYQDVSGGLAITPFTGTTVIAPSRDSNTIYVQRLTVTIINALAGGTWTFQDNSGTVVISAISVAAVGTLPVDFGAYGVPLTAGQSLVFVPSSTGASGVIEWDAYRRLAPGMAIALAGS